MAGQAKMGQGEAMSSDREQAIVRFWRAGERDKARRALQDLLDEELAAAVYGFVISGEQPTAFNDQHARSNLETGDPLRLQFLFTEAATRQATLAIVDGDLWTLTERFAAPAAETPRRHLRTAIVQADFRQWLLSPGGRSSVVRAANKVARDYWNVELEVEDVVQAALERLLRYKPYSRSYLYTVLANLYRDECRRRGPGLPVSLDIEEVGIVAERVPVDETGANRGGRPDLAAFTLLRKVQLFGLLDQVARQIPGMSVPVAGKRKPRRLSEEHARIFRDWLSLEPSARIDPELTVEEMAVERDLSPKTVQRRFTDLQLALTTHPRYAELLELMLPSRLLDDRAGDSSFAHYKARVDQMIRRERARFGELILLWKSELEREMEREEQGE